jgi:hypothetical protein
MSNGFLAAVAVLCKSKSSQLTFYPTVWYNMRREITQHLLTDVGVERFMADWEKVKRGT